MRLTDMITYTINHQLQVDVIVQVKTTAQWSQIIKQCPYTKGDTSNLYITFLSSPPVKKATPEIIAACTQ
jgi:Protein of unknown function (DUF1697)